MDAVLSRRLQEGDPGGHMRRALAAFPSPEMAARVLDKYFIEGGKAADTPYKPLPKLTIDTSRAASEVAVVGNFAEVWLAKEGHDGVVGINCLEKLQMATPTALLGASLAGADYVIMGAGIPRDIPQLLTDIAAGREGKIVADVAGGSMTRYIRVDPVDLLGDDLPEIQRPDFLAIVSADALANYLYRDESIRPDGFVVEGPAAGGHSAPPRGRMQLDDSGEPIYGARDIVNLQKMADLSLPFWLAGAYGTPDKVVEALADGAAGVQVGTLFALSLDSGLEERTRAQMIGELREGSLSVKNDPRASPTGFPFKVASLEGTQSQTAVYEDRPRLCDLSYLRSAYEKDNGDVGYRCPSEPVHMYLKKGGSQEATEGRKCLCNGLMANIGLGQVRKDGYAETKVVTLGQDLGGANALIEQHPQGWTARQAVQWLTSQSAPSELERAASAVA